jgi:hypothetical protein
MSEAKIEMKIGQIQFSGQGEQDWVAKQLDKILAQAEKLIQLAPPEAQDDEDHGGEHKPMTPDASISKKTLPVFLGEKNATTNQVRKFLAAAVWLEAKGKSRLQSKDVVEALRTANQTKLKNPALCLSRNVSKGHCEKDGNQFFVTDDGKKAL